MDIHRVLQGPQCRCHAELPPSQQVEASASAQSERTERTAGLKVSSSVRATTERTNECWEPHTRHCNTTGNRHVHEKNRRGCVRPRVRAFTCYMCTTCTMCTKCTMCVCERTCAVSVCVWNWVGGWDSEEGKVVETWGRGWGW